MPTPTATASESILRTSDLSGELYLAEDRHFWFLARNRLIEQIVRRLTSELADGFRVLEVGCGSGNVLRVLERICSRGLTIGCDRDAQRLEHARQRVACSLVRADIHDMPFDKPFDLIGLFDVLEHIADDQNILETLRSNLAPGGRLLITVPAHMSLWSYTDDLDHQRRYSPNGLKQVLEAASFHVEFVSQFMMALYPLMWLGRRWNARGRPTHGGVQAGDHERHLRELRVHPVVNAVVKAMLAWEPAIISRGWQLPLGTSLVVVARRI